MADKVEIERANALHRNIDENQQQCANAYERGDRAQPLEEPASGPTRREAGRHHHVYRHQALASP
jgi:hypothetical protein